MWVLAGLNNGQCAEVGGAFESFSPPAWQWLHVAEDVEGAVSVPCLTFVHVLIQTVNCKCVPSVSSLP